MGVAYTVVNHDGMDFNAVGTWTEDQGLAYQDYSYVWSWPTEDGTKPEDQVVVDPCPVGKYGSGGDSCFSW